MRIMRRNNITRGNNNLRIANRCITPNAVDNAIIHVNSREELTGKVGEAKISDRDRSKIIKYIRLGEIEKAQKLYGECEERPKKRWYKRQNSK